MSNVAAVESITFRYFVGSNGNAPAGPGRSSVVCRAHGAVVPRTGSFGYRNRGGILVEDKREQAVIGRIKEMRAQGSSLNAIAKTLNGEGRRGKNFGKWHPQTVARVLSR